MQRTFDPFLPEGEELVEAWKLREDIEFLPDEFLKQRLVVGDAVSDLGGRQAKAFDLPDKCG